MDGYFSLLKSTERPFIFFSGAVPKVACEQAQIQGALSSSVESPSGGMAIRGE
jgi:hypothetical protein